MLRKAIGLGAVLLAASVISGCNQNQQKTAEQQKTAQQDFVRGGHHGLRKVCADDIQKYCANDDRKRRCLRQNEDKLSEACKAAVAQGHGAHGGHKRDKDNDNKSDDDND
ncbi:MAG TPA: hypothetical protein VHU23_15445 [Rhizomicrobium sp.]|nr:hypothetical protein [Rhizomicrobium sp.]